MASRNIFFFQIKFQGWPLRLLRGWTGFRLGPVVRRTAQAQRLGSSDGRARKGKGGDTNASSSLQPQHRWTWWSSRTNLAICPRCKDIKKPTRRGKRRKDGRPLFIAQTKANLLLFNYTLALMSVCYEKVKGLLGRQTGVNQSGDCRINNHGRRYEWMTSHNQFGEKGLSLFLLGLFPQC